MRQWTIANLYWQCCLLFFNLLAGFSRLFAHPPTGAYLLYFRTAFNLIIVTRTEQLLWWELRLLFCWIWLNFYSSGKRTHTGLNYKLPNTQNYTSSCDLIVITLAQVEYALQHQDAAPAPFKCWLCIYLCDTICTTAAMFCWLALVNWVLGNFSEFY